MCQLGVGFLDYFVKDKIEVTINDARTTVRYHTLLYRPAGRLRCCQDGEILARL